MGVTYGRADGPTQGHSVGMKSGELHQGRTEQFLMGGDCNNYEKTFFVTSQKKI